jgi:hypothetical protein
MVIDHLFSIFLAFRGLTHFSAFSARFRRPLSENYNIQHAGTTMTNMSWVQPSYESANPDSCLLCSPQVQFVKQKPHMT